MLELTSELLAINSMLSTIGESPVNTVDDNGVVDAVIARQILRAVSREVQAPGWHFNTDESLLLTPSFPDGFLYVPATTLSVDTVGDSASLDVTQRGTRLYDRKNHTYVFTTPVTVDIVTLLDFEELPEPARQYIYIKAARRFQENRVGSDTLDGFTKNDEFRARATLKNTEAKNADYNILSTPFITDIVGR